MKAITSIFYRFRTGFLTGWGRVFSDDLHKLADNLQEAKVSVVDHDTCMKRNVLPVDTFLMICVGGAGSSGCSGDSGGPLMCRSKYSRDWVLYGIASWVISINCPGDAYTVYARVSTHTDWIRKNTGGMTIGKNLKK
jgi:secreted trypsin-like serine protease